jgi:hypothetical protein
MAHARQNSIDGTFTLLVSVGGAKPIVGKTKILRLHHPQQLSNASQVQNSG